MVKQLVTCYNYKQMAQKSDSYGLMLEKYREVDEDAILSNLTSEELEQLEVITEMAFFVAQKYLQFGFYHVTMTCYISNMA